MFWKRKSKTPAPQPSKNRVDELANRLQQEERIDLLESELGKFNPKTLEGVEKESWYHLYGAIPFQQGNRGLALERFREGLRRCPDSAILSFSLGQEHEFRGAIGEMFACFERAKFPHIPAQYALAEARYAYLWNRYEAAADYIRPLIPVYLQMKILDDMFLYIRGLTFFGQVWDYLAAFSKLGGNIGELKELTRKVEAECQDVNSEHLNAHLLAIETGDYSALKAILERRIAEWKPQGFPVGYHKMKYQILCSQSCTDPVQAQRLLDSVTLTPNDFPWLEDMRLLAKCDLAHRFGEAPQEAELRGRFLKQQPMLFEPDHTINFNLLEYQETLKEAYQGARKGASDRP
jgi:tetratricopeptide (TPR) repeat protein